jgi:hypothetical protein
MTRIILAQYKCPHCGALNTSSRYLSWNNFSGSGPGQDPFVGVCHECKKEYNKGECYIKDLKEGENDDDFGIPAFIKKRMQNK